MSIFKRKVNEYMVRDILYQFVNSVTVCKMIIYYEISRSGVIKLYTNRPGILVGKGGETIYAIKDEMISKANVKDVKIIEMKRFVSNFNEYGIY